jgi:AraC family transcriptional regulator
LETFADRIDTASRSRVKFTPKAVTLQDAGLWPGIRIERWEGKAEPQPESILPFHGLAVSVDMLSRVETKWLGHRPQKAVIGPGSVTILPAGIAYSSVSSGYWRGHMVAIATDYVDAIAHSSGTASTALIPRLGQNDPIVREVVSALVREIETNYQFGPTYGEALCAALVAHLLRNHAAKAQVDGFQCPSGDVRREWIRSYLLDQLEKQISLAEIAQLLQMDVFSLTRWFKQEFGLPPHQFIMQARVDRAREMLKRSDLSLVELALQCGFCSQSHLTTSFRRRVGVSPGAFRASFAQHRGSRN